MLARKSVSACLEASESLGWKSPNTSSCVSSVCRTLRFHSYSQAQKNVLPPGTCSTSSVST